MGIEAAVIGSVIGGVSAARSDRKSAQKSVESQERQKADSQAFIEKSMNQARGDLFKLFPEAQESRQAGIQAGLDLFKQTIPIQAQLFEQGNVGAQEQLIQGLPGIEAAFLGQQTPFEPQVTRSGIEKLPFSLPETPQFSPISQGIQQSAQVAPNPQIEALMQAFGGQ